MNMMEKIILILMEMKEWLTINSVANQTVTLVIEN